MRCRECGTEVPEGSAVCPSCGAKLMRHLSDDDAAFVDSVPVAEPTPAERKLSKQVRRAAKERFRTERLALRRGGDLQGDPHIHTHVSTRFAMNPVRGAEEAAQDHRRHRVRIGVLVALLVAAVAAGIGYVTWSAEAWGGRTVPDVCGLDPIDASSRLVQAGFVVRQEDVVDDASVGLVVKMSPVPGSRAAIGSSITVYVGVSTETATAEARAATSDAKTSVSTASPETTEQESEGE